MYVCFHVCVCLKPEAQSLHGRRKKSTGTGTANGRREMGSRVGNMRKSKSGNMLKAGWCSEGAGAFAGSGLRPLSQPSGSCRLDAGRRTGTQAPRGASRRDGGRQAKQPFFLSCIQRACFSMDCSRLLFRISFIMPQRARLLLLGVNATLRGLGSTDPDYTHIFIQNRRRQKMQ